VFDQGWFRVIVTSLMLGAYGTADFVARVSSWRHRPRGGWRPLWSHALGFASVLMLFSLAAASGRGLQGGLVNQIGVALCLLAAVARVAYRKGGTAVRYPDLTGRLLCFAALPLVAGAPAAWLAFTLPQAIIAAQEALRRDRAAVARGEAPKPTGSRIVPGLW